MCVYIYIYIYIYRKLPRRLTATTIRFVPVARDPNRAQEAFTAARRVQIAYMGHTWPYMDRIWAIYGPYMGHIYSQIYIGAIYGSIYGHIWTIYGPIWPHMVPYMAKYGPYLDQVYS